MPLSLSSHTGGRNGGDNTNECNYEKNTSPLGHALTVTYQIRQVRGLIMVILWMLFSVLKKTKCRVSKEN